MWRGTSGCLSTTPSKDVQRLKAALNAKSPKTVNNVLAVLSVLLRKTVEWQVIDRMPCTVKLLPVPKGSAAFYDCDLALGWSGRDWAPTSEGSATQGDDNLNGGEAGIRTLDTAFDRITV